MSSKFRLALPSEKEESKSILILLANLCGIPKQPSNPEFYARAVIDYYPRLLELVKPRETELEELFEPREFDAEIAYYIDRAIGRIVRKVRKR